MTTPERWSGTAAHDLRLEVIRPGILDAIDPAAFGEPEEFRQSVSAYINEVKSSRKAPGIDEILMPGERSFAALKRRRL